MTILYQKKQTGKIWEWSIHVNGPIVVTTYGYIDGAKQSTSETASAMNVGKSNEISPEAQALLIMERRIKDKTDNGYVESFGAAQAQSLEGEPFSFDALPKNFCPAKPISAIESEKLRKLWDAGRLIVQRKFDGMCHFGVRSENSVYLLSRAKLEDKAAHVPEVTKLLQYLPSETIVNGELCCIDGGDDFKHVSSVLRTKDPQEAVAKQLNHVDLRYIVFDVLYWAGEDVSGRPYKDRIKLMNKIDLDPIDSPHIQLPQDMAKRYSFEELFGPDNIAKRDGLEGYVVWDKEESTEIRWDGKEARKNCYKVKMTHTEDVWVDNPRPGKGKNEACLGKLAGWQYGPDGRKIFIGDIGGGYSQEQRKDFWENRSTLFPCVVEVETAERIVGSLKLRFPVFIRIRPDKVEKECIMQLMPRGSD